MEVYSKMNTFAIDMFTFHHDMISIFWNPLNEMLLGVAVTSRVGAAAVNIHHCAATGQPTDTKKRFLPMRCWTCCTALAMLQIRTRPQTGRWTECARECKRWWLRETAIQYRLWQQHSNSVDERMRCKRSRLREMSCLDQNVWQS